MRSRTWSVATGIELLVEHSANTALGRATPVCEFPRDREGACSRRARRLGPGARFGRGRLVRLAILSRMRQLVGARAEVELRPVESPEVAEAERFTAFPTVRPNRQAVDRSFAGRTTTGASAGCTGQTRDRPPGRRVSGFGALEVAT